MNLVKNLGMLDFDLATNNKDQDLYYLLKKSLRIERALSNFMLDTHIVQNGYLRNLTSINSF